MHIILTTDLLPVHLLNILSTVEYFIRAGHTTHKVTCQLLTHWGRVTHKCVSKLAIIGSDNGFSPHRRQAIIWTNAGLLLIGPLGTNFSEILIEILTCSFKKMCLKVSSAKRRPFCLGLNVLIKAQLSVFHMTQKCFIGITSQEHRCLICCSTVCSKACSGYQQKHHQNFTLLASTKGYDAKYTSMS